jgi:hypothetical protein
MLQLPANLRLLDEPAHQVRLILMTLQQDFDRQIAPQVRVAALEHRAHPASRDLSEELVAIAALTPEGISSDDGLTIGTPVSSIAVSGSSTIGIEPIERTRLSRTWPGWVGSKANDVCTPTELSAGQRPACGPCRARSAHSWQIACGSSERSGFPQRLQRRNSVMAETPAGEWFARLPPKRRKKPAWSQRKQSQRRTVTPQSNSVKLLVLRFSNLCFLR